MDFSISRKTTGYIFLIISALAWSTSGFFVVLSSASLIEIVFWRSFSGAIALVAFLAAIRGKNAFTGFSRLGTAGITASLLMVLGLFAFITAFQNTSIASVHVIYSSSWLIAAIIAYIFIREKISRSTVVGGFLASFGVVVVFWSDISTGAIVGNSLALVMTVCVAITTIIINKNPSIPVLELAGISAIFATIFAAAIIPGKIIPNADTLPLVMFGIVNVAIGWTCYFYGSKIVQPADAALTSTLEVPIVILTSSILLGIRPGISELTGASLVIAGLCISISKFRINIR